MNLLDTVGIIFVLSDGEYYQLTYEARVDTFQLPRRLMAQALRELADEFDADAEKVGD